MADGTTTVTVDPAAIAREVQKALAANGGDAKEVLVRQNVKYRARLAALEAELKAAKEQAPADGSVVLTPEQAKTWAAFEALKLEPDKITAALTERDALKLSNEKRERSDRIREAAEATGYKPSVLEAIRGVDELKFETVSEKNAKDEAVRVAYVTGTEQGAQRKKLTDYVQEKHPDLLPALAADEQEKPPPTRRFNGQVQDGRPPNTKPPTVEEIAARKRQSGAYAI